MVQIILDWDALSVLFSESLLCYSQTSRLCQRNPEGEADYGAGACIIPLNIYDIQLELFIIV